MQDILGDYVEIIDPSPAVAKQVLRVLEREDALTTRTITGITTAITTGDIYHFKTQLHHLGFAIDDVRRGLWQLGHLLLRT
jgi:glutamate racemase